MEDDIDIVNYGPVDPVLLSKKLEVARLERDAHPSRGRLRTSQNAAALLALDKRRSREVRRSVQQPPSVQCMADGKPCLNTQQILATLNVDVSGYDDARAVATRDFAYNPRHSRKSHDHGPHKRNDHGEVGSCRNSLDRNERPAWTARKRAHKHADSLNHKMLPAKHGSQTTYERAPLRGSQSLDVLRSSKLENGEFHRPRLSKYDRPHWAQQSQRGEKMHIVSQMLPPVRMSKQPDLSDVPPPVPEKDYVVGGVRGVYQPKMQQQQQRHSQRHEALTALPVLEVKRTNSRLGRMRTFSRLFKRLQ